MDKPDTPKFLIIRHPALDIVGAEPEIIRKFNSPIEADTCGTYLSNKYTKEGRDSRLSLFQRIKSYPPARQNKKKKRFYLPLLGRSPFPLCEVSCWECGNKITFGEDEHGYYLEEGRQITFNPPLTAKPHLIEPDGLTEEER